MASWPQKIPAHLILLLDAYLELLSFLILSFRRGSSTRYFIYEGGTLFTQEPMLKEIFVGKLILRDLSPDL